MPSLMAKKEHRRPSYPATLRMARIAFELPFHPFGWSLESIRRELRISERTLKRYLAAGQDSLVDRLGRPYFQVVTDGKPKLRLPASRKPLESTAYQLVSLYFTLTILKFLDGTVLEEGIEDLWEKFSKSVPAYERADLGTLDRTFYAIPYAPKDYRGLNHLLNPIVQGLLREYRLQIEYASGLVHEVEPYTLVAYRGGLYLIGKTHVNDRIITLAVERMRKVDLLAADGGGFQKFAYPATFRPERGRAKCSRGWPVPGDQNSRPIRLRLRGRRAAQADHGTGEPRLRRARRERGVPRSLGRGQDSPRDRARLSQPRPI